MGSDDNDGTRPPDDDSGSSSVKPPDDGWGELPSDDDGWGEAASELEAGEAGASGGSSAAETDLEDTSGGERSTAPEPVDESPPASPGGAAEAADSEHGRPSRHETEDDSTDPPQAAGEELEELPFDSGRSVSRDLRDVVDDDDDDDDDDEARRGPGRRRREQPSRLSARTRLTLISIAVGSVLITVVGVLSWWNSKNYYLTCTPNAVIAERGSMWPWGHTTLDGPEWRAIPLAQGAECEAAEFDDPVALEGAFVDILVEHASADLAPGPPEDVAETAAQLEQALILTRSPSRADLRRQVTRLQGDVEYWRARDDVSAALESLSAARTRFESAIRHNPRHRRDSSVWAEHVEHLTKRLKGGPGSAEESKAPARKDSPASAATTDQGAKPVASGADAGAESPGEDGTARAEESPNDRAPPPIPEGGVLL